MIAIMGTRHICTNLLSLVPTIVRLTYIARQGGRQIGQLIRTSSAGPVLVLDMVTKSTWFITGTSRGIGLQFVRQLIEDPANIVIASCRSPESAIDLNGLVDTAKGELHIVKLDVATEESIEAAAIEVDKILNGKGLDYLLNNAGVNPGDDDAFDFKVNDLQYAMQNNVIGPALIAQHFIQYLEKGNRKVLMNMTSGLASIGLNLGKKCASYSISKAALNMLNHKQAAARPDIIAIVVDPGWVKTAMGGAGAFLEPTESVTPFINFLKGVTEEQSGGFFDYKGQTKPCVRMHRIRSLMQRRSYFVFDPKKFKQRQKVKRK